MNTQTYRDLAAKGNAPARAICKALDEEKDAEETPVSGDGVSAESHEHAASEHEKTGKTKDAISSWHKAAVASSAKGDHEGVKRAVENAERLHGNDCGWLHGGK
jgi:hypothetical protein